MCIIAAVSSSTVPTQGDGLRSQCLKDGSCPTCHLCQSPSQHDVPVMDAFPRSAETQLPPHCSALQNIHVINVLLHRTVERFGLEGTFKDHQVRPLPQAETSSTRLGCSKPTRLGCSKPYSTWHGTLQWWGIHNFITTSRLNLAHFRPHWGHFWRKFCLWQHGKKSPAAGFFCLSMEGNCKIAWGLWCYIFLEKRLMASTQVRPS